MPEKIDYTHLGPRVASSYHQFFFRGRNLRAETLYRATVGAEAMVPEDVARDHDIPVEAVLEAIDYRTRNGQLLSMEREKDWAQS